MQCCSLYFWEGGINFIVQLCFHKKEFDRNVTLLIWDILHVQTTGLDKATKANASPGMHYAEHVWPSQIYSDALWSADMSHDHMKVTRPPELILDRQSLCMNLTLSQPNSYQVSYSAKKLDITMWKTWIRQKQCLPHQSSKDFCHIWIISPRLWDCDTQFCITQGPKGTDPPSTDPDDEWQSHWACMLQHAFRRDEYPRTDDVT